MKIFLDTADVVTIRRLNATGLIDGVTTNPTLIKKAGNDPYKIYEQIGSLGIKDISMEVTGTVGEMYDEAQNLVETFGDLATIKLPMTEDGLLVCHQLSHQGVRTNVTLVFCIPQAILAAKAGATYVSPFVGRLDDQQVSGLEVVRGISSLLRMKGSPTQVLAASIRTVHRAVRSFYNGADIVTLPPSVFEGMYKNLLTDKGLEIFERDAAEIRSNRGSLKQLFS